MERLLAGDLEQNIQLQPFDSLVVPNAEMIYVQGEVRAPSAMKYTSVLTVARAIAQAGGTTQMGAPGRIDLNRLDGAKRVHMKVDLEKILKGETPDLALRPGDVIYVPTRLF